MGEKLKYHLRHAKFAHFETLRKLFAAVIWLKLILSTRRKHPLIEFLQDKL